MALIKCPECGKEISDKAGKCPHCGKILKQESEIKNTCPECQMEIPDKITECPYCGYPLEENETKNSISCQIVKTIKKHKKYLCTIIVTVIIAMILGLFINYMRFSLNEDEMYVYENALKLKDMMNDPDSFKIYENAALLEYYNDNGELEHKYTVIEYGATNGYGANIKDEAIFEDTEYIMDYSDEPAKEDGDYLDKMKIKLNVMSGFIHANDDTWKLIEIDVEKLKHKMGIN